MTFLIGSVKEIQWNDGAFDNLVLPKDHKELILALTESQVQNKDDFDDVIQGKGERGRAEHVHSLLTLLTLRRQGYDHALERSSWGRQDSDG